MPIEFEDSLQRTVEQLVRAACDGDVDSFGELYRRYFHIALGIGRSRLADVHLAEDCAQDAFATACRKLHTLKEPGRFGEWLATICRRAATRAARRRLPSHALDQEPVAPDSTDNVDVAPIQEALRRISDAGREVIHLHYFSGLTYEEIARVLGITPDAVHGRLQRARRAIAVEMAQANVRRVSDG